MMLKYLKKNSIKLITIFLSVIFMTSISVIKVHADSWDYHKEIDNIFDWGLEYASKYFDSRLHYDNQVLNYYLQDYTDYTYYDRYSSYIDKMIELNNLGMYYIFKIELNHDFEYINFILYYSDTKFSYTFRTGYSNSYSCGAVPNVFYTGFYNNSDSVYEYKYGSSAGFYDYSLSSSEFSNLIKNLYIEQNDDKFYLLNQTSYNIETLPNYAYKSTYNCSSDYSTSTLRISFSDLEDDLKSLYNVGAAFLELGVDKEYLIPHIENSYLSNYPFGPVTLPNLNYEIKEPDYDIEEPSETLPFNPEVDEEYSSLLFSDLMSDGPLDSILLLPINYLDSLKSAIQYSSCVRPTFEFGNNLGSITLLCPSEYYDSIGLNSIINWLGYIAGFLMLWAYIIRFYGWLNNMLILNNDAEKWGIS